MWDGFDFTVNARLAQRPDDADRHAAPAARMVDTCETVTSYNNVSAATVPSPVPTRAGAATSSRGRRRCAAWRATPSRRSTSSSAPSCDRSRRPLACAGHRHRPRSGRCRTRSSPPALGHLPPGATATGNTKIQLTDNEHRVYSDERRTQIDMRVREDPALRPHAHRHRRRPEQPAQHQLRDGLQHDVYLQHGQHAAPERLGHADQPSTTRGSCA